MINFGAQEVKGQDHTKPKLDLETWRGVTLDPFGRVGFLVFVCVVFQCFVNKILASNVASSWRPLFCYLVCLTAFTSRSSSHVVRWRRLHRWEN